MKFYSMFHRGGLDESLKTKELISESEFKKLFKLFKYEYYCFDERINCIRFIIGDITKHYIYPTWLLISLD